MRKLYPVCFEDVKVGRHFMYFGSEYIRINDCSVKFPNLIGDGLQNVNALNLLTYEGEGFGSDVMVHML